MSSSMTIFVTLDEAALRAGLLLVDPLPSLCYSALHTAVVRAAISVQAFLPTIPPRHAEGPWPEQPLGTSS